jgi:hypothetical protein
MDVGQASPASDTSLSVKFGGLTALLNGRQRQQPEQSNNKLTLRAVSEGGLEQGSPIRLPTAGQVGLLSLTFESPQTSSVSR